MCAAQKRKVMNIVQFLELDYENDVKVLERTQFLV